MDHDPRRFVPKVHPATRAVAPDDPMTLHATAVAGDPDGMIRAVVQEYAGMGWDLEQILGLFADPCYPLLHGLWLALGESGVRERIAAVLRGHSVSRLRVTIREALEIHEPELVQIGPGRPKGGDHGDSL